MWVLDVIHTSTSSVETSFYLIAGEWSIGRKKCHFNFPSDSSISRAHALIRVGAFAAEQVRDLHTRPALVLVDQNSRFGSFVNQVQCFGERELKNGDQITFGAKRTVLRVRYQVFTLVASRIARANRARVNDTCQRIGMHLIPSESKDATHCIMDPGRIVATVKVLWALVFNQPVVTTSWIYAILERKSLSEPLPRCEQFLPTDEAIPSVTSSYLPNPMRKNLFHRLVVVFLTPQSMEELITAMEGVVISAYKDHDHDEMLLREIEQHAASRDVLIVEPAQGSGFSSAAASSDVRETGSTNNASVERRIDLFRSIGATFATVQELAASVIFAKTPTAASECSFSSSLAGHHSMAAPIMSFPEHLSLRPHADDSEDDRDVAVDAGSSLKHDVSVSVHEPVTSRHVPEDDLPILPPQPIINKRRIRSEPAFTQPSDDIVEESVLIKDEPPSFSSMQRRHVVASDRVNDLNILDLPAPQQLSEDRDFAPCTLGLLSCGHASHVDNWPVIDGLDGGDNATAPAASAYMIHETGVASVESEIGAWKCTRDRPPRSMKDMPADVLNELEHQAVVISCSLIVNKPRVAGVAAAGSNLRNFKRFKKGNGYEQRSAASLFPKQTVISVTVDNADREAMHQDLEALEEQERIAEELFAMVEKRTTKKRL